MKEHPDSDHAAKRYPCPIWLVVVVVDDDVVVVVFVFQKSLSKLGFLCLASF